jgi:N4-gp56 family major capsid protein
MTTLFAAIDVGQKIISKKLIDILKQNLILYKTAVIQKVPAGSNSKTMIFRGFNKLSLATTALSEGVVPVGQNLTINQVTVTLAQYGDLTRISDVAEFLWDRSLIKDASDVFGIQASETIETVVLNAVAAGTTAIFGDGTVFTRGTVTAAMKMTTTIITRAVRFLESNNVKKFAPMPIIGNAFAGLFHANVVADIRLDTNFIQAVNYSSPNPSNSNRGDLFTGELGQWMGVRIISSTIAPYYGAVGAASANVYGSLIYGDGAYAVSEFEGGLSTFIKTGGVQDTSNPLNQFSTVGWKWFGAAVILDNNRIVRAETSATYNGSTV